MARRTIGLVGPGLPEASSAAIIGRPRLAAIRPLASSAAIRNRPKIWPQPARGSVGGSAVGLVGAAIRPVGLLVRSPRSASFGGDPIVGPPSAASFGRFVWPRSDRWPPRPQSPVGLIWPLSDRWSLASLDPIRRWPRRPRFAVGRKLGPPSASFWPRSARRPRRPRFAVAVQFDRRPPRGLTAPLWTGAVSDTYYNERAGYLKDQEKFQNKDKVLIRSVNGEGEKHQVVPFTNIYDKGYRAKLVAWRAGKQRVLQPVWANSDRRFERDETLLTASVATDRGGNERAVNVSKRAWYVSRGFQQNSCPKQLNDAWMTWSFQSNFMFEPVL
jgi:hypothetical protein